MQQLQQQHNKNSKKLCICPKCGKVYVEKTRGTQEEIVMAENVCHNCVRNLTLLMDNKHNLRYA